MLPIWTRGQVEENGVQLKKSLLKIVRQYQGLCGQLLEQDDSSTLDAHVTEVENVFEDSLGAFGRDDEEEVTETVTV